MTTKILRTVIGLPVVLIIWVSFLLTGTFVWSIFGLYDFCVYGYLHIHWIEMMDDCASPYQFLKKVWK